MSLMAWQGVDGIARTREANQIRLEQTMRLQTVIAQWEQDLASLQESAAVPALTCDGQSVRLTRRTDGGLQVVAWSLRPDDQRLDLAALGRPGGDDDDGAAEQLARAPSNSRATSPASCARSAASTSGRSTSTRATPGPTASRPATSSAAGARRRRGPACAGGRRCPPGVRLVLAFAPGSGLDGSLDPRHADRAMTQRPSLRSSTRAQARCRPAHRDDHRRADRHARRRR